MTAGDPLPAPPADGFAPLMADRFARGIAVSFYGIIAIGVLNYMMRRLLLAHLSAASYGFFYSAFALASLGTTFIGSGLGLANIVLIARWIKEGLPARAREVCGHVLLARGIGGGLLGVALALAAPALLRRFWAYPDGFRTLMWMSLFVPACAVFGGAVNILNAVMDFRARTVADVLQYALALILAVAGIRTYGVAAPAAALAVSNVALLPAVLRYLHRRHRMLPMPFPIRKPVVGEIWRFSRWTMMSVTGLYLMANVDTLMLTSLRGLEDVAVYHVAQPVVQIFLAVLVVPTVFAPIAADLWQRGLSTPIARLTGLVADAALAYGCGLMIVLLPSAPWVLRLLFGASFDRAAAPLIVLAAGVPLLVMAQFFLHTVAAINRPMAVARVTAVAVASNVALNALLIPSWGVVGAAAATTAAYGVLMWLGYLELKRRLGVRVRHGLSPAAVGVAVLAVGCSWALGTVWTSAWGAVGAPLVGCLLYAVLARKFLLRVITDGASMVRGKWGQDN